MIYFQLELTCAPVSPEAKTDASSAHAKPDERKLLEICNTDLLDFYEWRSLPVFLQFLCFRPDNKENLLACAAYDSLSVETGKIDIKADFSQACRFIEFPYELRAVVFHEIHTLDYLRLIERYSMETQRVRKLFRDKFGATYARYGTTGYQAQERIVPGNQIRNKATAKKELKKLMPDAALAEEVDRIFSRKHPKDLYYGIPVHYKITAKSDLIADEIIDVMISGLFLNKRILSRRITKIERVEARHFDTQSFEELVRCSQNSAIEILLTGDVATEQEYASQFHWISDLLAESIKKNCDTILFFFVENANHPGFAKQLLGKLDEELDILEIQEGVGNARQADSYFRNLLKNSNMQKYYENDTIFEKGRFYSASEIRSQFQQWRKTVLKNQVYSAYKQNPALKISRKLSEKGSAYEQLQKMVGLTEVKEIVQGILAAFKVQKLRNAYYDPVEISTQHMIFTGNPGTAKTTVARLLTEILKENHILKTGAFLEVGRADLVGKYVGWTASIVKEKFSRAQGGILFIDEAYALSDDSHTYGEEAINTIVQEMENKRGDVIVIFAGYPEKMTEFLTRNEGLRSRIAFHVHFPDYEPEELMGILDLMLTDRHYVLTPAAREKTAGIFQQVYRQKEYGNGRFVRNLFEQAVKRQAVRITQKEGYEITREMLFELDAPDFDTNIVKQYQKRKTDGIGFLGSWFQTEPYDSRPKD